MKLGGPSIQIFTTTSYQLLGDLSSTTSTAAPKGLKLPCTFLTKQRTKQKHLEIFTYFLNANLLTRNIL